MSFNPAPATEGHHPTPSGEMSSDLGRTTSEQDVIAATVRMLEILEEEREKADLHDDYLAGRHRRPYMPPDAGRTEYALLAERSINNVMPLVINNIAQLLYIEGFQPSEVEDDDHIPAWVDGWQANQMDRKQNAMWRAALKDGVAYAAVTPGEGGPRIRAVSARRMIALYEDPANDEWPIWALEVAGPAYAYDYRVYDDTHVYQLREMPRQYGENAYEVVGATRHQAPVCPVVRIVPSLDLEGRYQGEIAPLITSQDRLNQTTMDRLMVQSFGSWKIRTISGMDLPADQQEARTTKFDIAQDRFLVAADADTRFGSIPETPLQGFLTSIGSDQETIGALAAVPPHYLTGSLNNLGAEAIAEARASLEAKVNERKHAFGEAAEQILRLCGWYLGDMDGWADYGAQVAWADAQNRSLSSVADALLKLMSLGIPPQMLWERVPGVTKGDLDRWRAAVADDELTEILRAMAGGGDELSQPDTQASAGSSGDSRGGVSGD